jgi:hypothetical protein
MLIRLVQYIRHDQLPDGGSYRLVQRVAVLYAQRIRGKSRIG